MRVSDHLAQYHEASAAHHDKMIDAHEAALDKAAGMESAAQTDFHKAAIKSHKKMRDYHQGAMAECQKAIQDYLGKTLVPDRISGIVTNFPNAVAVPRFGQRELDKPDVPVELAHLVEIPED